MAVLGQGRLTQSGPARSQPPCLIPSRLIPTTNEHIVLVHVNRLHSGGELSLQGALLHLGIDSVPSTYISGLTPLARPEQIPPELQVPVHIVHDTHVHNGTFITHSPYGLHAAEETEAAFVSPLFAPPRASAPGSHLFAFLLPSLSDTRNRANRKA